MTPSSDLPIVEGLHVGILRSIARSRREQSSRLIFQGGSALSMMYGSGRHSEDLDFIVSPGVPLNDMMKDVLRDIRTDAKGHSLYKPEQITLAAAKGNDSKPLKVYELRYDSGNRAVPLLRVKVEFFEVPTHLVHSYKFDPQRPMRFGHSMNVRPLVPTADLQELFVDKLHALGNRAYLKYRDVYDIWWITQMSGEFESSTRDGAVALLRDHHAMYGQAENLAALKKTADQALSRLSSANPRSMRAELGRFLLDPPSDERLSEMLNATRSEVEMLVRALEETPEVGMAL